MQLLVRRHAAGTYDIGKKFFATPLGDQALSDLGTAAANRSDYDLRILFLKIRQHLFVTADVNGDLTFFLCRSQDVFPFQVPSWFFRLGRVDGIDWSKHWHRQQQNDRS